MLETGWLFWVLANQKIRKEKWGDKLKLCSDKTVVKAMIKRWGDE
jgi:hypothetical protein